jgi:hypothetical protein
MFWVWILPFAALSMAFMLYPTYQPFVIGQFRYLSTASAFSHFFGRGCEVRKLCFDQLYLTMPFYTASAYSLASWFANKMAGRGGFEQPVRVINLWRTFLVSSIVFLCLTLDSVSNIYSENRLSLVGEVAIVVMITVVEAAAATFLIVIGSGLVVRKSLSKAFFFKARD